MKKFFSTVAALFTVMCLTFTCFAEDVTKSFSMVSNTGIITIKGSSAIELSLEPDVYENDSIVIYNNGTIPNITSVKLEVEGLKYHRNYTITNSYYFKNYIDRNCLYPTTDNSGDYWKLEIYTESAPINSFLVDMYEEIYSIGIVATAYFETDSSKVYYDWKIGTYVSNEVPVFDIVKYFNEEASLTSLIEDLVVNVKNFDYVSKEVKNDYPFIPNTDRDRDSLVSKAEVDILSYSALGTGNGIKGFEGLASQVSTFFNKQTNGKIIFKITNAPAVISTQWVEGGIPSTQVGLYVPNVNNIVMGLFFNYDTTGSLMTPGVLTSDGYITFDITDVLNAIGGNTVASIHSIFYGLVGGLAYNDQPSHGFKIDEVTLSYNDGINDYAIVLAPETTATTTAPITTEPEQWYSGVAETTTAATTTTEEPITVEDEPEDVMVPDAPEADYDTTTAPEPVATLVDDYVAINNSNDDEDTNPATGVGLAPIPFMIATAAIAMFKKRK